ncbi:winged helix-turn-helix domain-containing protein [Acidithiobacillus ferrivorans]|uniref:Winged-helix domain-containing protein n=1 Tax=Acidithiobacillus ferrivorans TaxID=160808 RepID=A0A7T4WFU9_9PROT|nr:winged helix-turn-helix domain-containing protein [Acidithiobacillus ferrivorans]QQD73771.1 winged-helix domain-containing protein [Acidithiobacillus ferrivorans]
MFNILLGNIYLQHVHAVVMETLAWLHLPTCIHTPPEERRIFLIAPNAHQSGPQEVEYALVKNGYRVQRITSQQDVEKLSEGVEIYHVVVYGWPDNSREHLRFLRDICHKTAPFLVIGDSTEADSGSIAVAAIEAGAAAFIPWALGEGLLMAHLRRLADEMTIRRMELAKLPGQIQLDPRSRRVSIFGHELYLPKQLFRLFEYMVTHPDEAISYHQLLQVLAEGKKIYIAPNTLVVKIYRLRRILEDTGVHRWLETIPGFGYRFCPPKHVTRLVEQSTQ